MITINTSSILSLLLIILILESIAITYSTTATPTRNKYRPLIGGIQVETKGDGSSDLCTISYSVKDKETGKKGVLVPAHCLPSLIDTIKAYQPTASDNNYIGDVTIIYHNGDLSFVDTDDAGISVSAKVLIINNDGSYCEKPVIGYIKYGDVNNELQSQQDQVMFTGRSSGFAKGIYLYTLDSLTLYLSPALGIVTVYNVIVIHAVVDNGDSGAPAFIYGTASDGTEGVKLIGHLFAYNANETNAYISSVSNAITGGFDILTYTPPPPSPPPLPPGPPPRWDPPQPFSIKRLIIIIGFDGG